jgi:Xaa-Pro aminopeptidase
MTTTMTLSPAQRRIQRVSEQMEAAGADVLLAASPSAIAYLADLNIRPFTAPGTVLILGPGGNTTLLASEADQPKIEASGYRGRTDYWPLDEDAEERRQSVLRLHLSGLPASSQIAAEGSALQYSVLQEAALPAEPILEAAMRIKDDDEVRRLRAAADLADIGYTAVVDRMTPELRVYEIVRNVDRSLRRAGGGEAWSPLEDPAGITRAGYYPSGSIANLLGRHAETGVLDPGQPLPFALYPLSENYTGAAGTTIVFEAPGPLLKSIAEALTDATEAALDAIRPGVRAEEVFAIHRQALQGTVSPDRLDPVIGYSVGTGIGRPLLSAKSEDVLEAGMALSVRTAIAREQGPGIAYQTTVLVTETGSERLNIVPLRLIELH